MGIIGYFFLSLALAMDCFSVSITCGIIQKKMGRQVVLMALLFGFFQAMMPFIGWVAADLFSGHINTFDHWVAFALLAFIGGRMIWNTFRASEDDHHFNPSNLKVLIALAVATSIDALAVGISFIGMGIRTISDVMPVLAIIGIVSAIMSVLGKFIGIHIGRRFNFPAELFGGIILVIIGIKVLVQHLLE